MKPSPVASAHICSACGLDWKRHGEKPSLETCVSLLNNDLAKAKAKGSEWESSSKALKVVGGQR